jgi:hypothetical protein
MSKPTLQDFVLASLFFTGIVIFYFRSPIEKYIVRPVLSVLGVISLGLKSAVSSLRREDERRG